LCIDVLKAQRDAARAENEAIPQRIARDMAGILEDAAAEHRMLQRISGALVDAKDVPVEPYDEAVRELVRQRDEARAKLAEYERKSLPHDARITIAKLDEAVALLHDAVPLVGAVSTTSALHMLALIDAFLAGQAEETKPQT
jgi:hypothetical protein